MLINFATSLIQRKEIRKERMSDNNEINKVKNKFTEFLKSKRLRKTPERFEILYCSLECNGHFDADLLYNLLDKRGYHVSKATIYNTLDLLSEAGIVRKLIFDTHQARYEVADKTHSHLICTQCGKITELDVEFPDADSRNLKLQGFSPSYVSICIYGICKDCLHDTNQSQKR